MLGLCLRRNSLPRRIKFLLLGVLCVIYLAHNLRNVELLNLYPNADIHLPQLSQLKDNVDLGNILRKDFVLQKYFTLFVDELKSWYIRQLDTLL